MRTLIPSALLAVSLLLSATVQAVLPPAVPPLDLLGSSPAVAGSSASLEVDFTSQTITWSSSDSRLGAIDLVSVAPQTWIQTADRLAFRYSNGADLLLVGSLLLGQPDRTVVDVLDGQVRARYLFKLDPGVLPVLSIADLTVNEEAGVAELTLSLDAEPLQPVSVHFTCTPGTASRLDFDSSPGSVDIPAGQRQATLAIPLVNDLRVERIENFVVTLDTPVRATIGDGSATVSIEDVDTTVVSVFDTTVDEDFVPDARVPIRLSAPSDFITVVRHNTSGRSAVEQVDFSKRSNDTTFTPGQLESMLYIPITDDSNVEGDEHFICFLMNVVGERASLGRTEATITIYDDDDDIKTPRADEIGWQWPNNAIFRPELDHQDYLMSEGALVVAQNFGHGTAGSTTTVAGIPFINNGVGAVNIVGFVGSVNWSVTAPGGTTSDAGGDDLFFSEIQSVDLVRLDVSGLDPAKRYVVQLLFGESQDVDARRWEIASDLGDFANGEVGGPLYDYVRRGFGQGPVGNGIAGEAPADNRDRRILSFGICGRTEFYFENLGWDRKAASLSGFQIREVPNYPRSPDVVTLERIAGLHWTGEQLIATCDEGVILTSPETVEWTRRDPVGSRRDLNKALDIENVGGTILISGRFGQLYTSTDDGVTWAAQDSGTREPLYGISDLGSRVVVVGEDGTIITSTDLVNWTPRDSGTGEILVGIAWNGSTLVVVGNRGTVATSPDGITFTSFQVPTATNVNLNNVIWDGSRFLATGIVRGSATGSGVLFTSLDGTTWNKLAYEARAALTQMNFNGSLYIVGDQNGSIYTSPDAENWTEQIPIPNDGVRSIAWTGKRFVVGCQNGDFMWSADGVEWSSETGVALAAPLLAIPGHSAWAARHGIEVGDLTVDCNGDGFAELFNYAMGVSPEKLITNESPGLLPGIDRQWIAGRATATFQLPASLPDDLRLEVEKSTDGERWSIIASRRGGSEWDVDPDNLVVEDDPVGGFRLTRFTAAREYATQPVALYRLRASIAP